MSGPVVIKVGEEEELKCPTCGKPRGTGEEVVIIHTKTVSPFSMSDFVAASSNLITRKPATPSLKGVWLLSIQAKKYSNSAVSASVCSILGAHIADSGARRARFRN